MKTDAGTLSPTSVVLAYAGTHPPPPSEELALVKTDAGIHPPNPHPLQTPSPYCYP